MTTKTSNSKTLWFADAWFRGAGTVALGTLAGTAIMLALRMDAWRLPFVLAHLCALLALVPLGLVLVSHTLSTYYRARSSFAAALRGTLTHDRFVTALVIVVFTAATISLSQFEGGVRWVRAAANYATVSAILVLVVRYLRSR